MMSKKIPTQKRKASADWFVQGALTKIGDIFDRLTGRGWKPSSTLATSELIERLKTLLDKEAVEETNSRKFVPHAITLRMQWDKFSSDAELSIKKLENELLTAAADHINDRHYYTYGPLRVEVRSDYFTDGVTIQTSFDRSDETSEGEMKVAIPEAGSADLLDGVAPSPLPIEVDTAASFSLEGTPTKTVPLYFVSEKRLTVGRTKENDLMIDDVSVSKYHASLLMNSEGRYFVADTGSTNGTFVNGQRISYGKAVRIRQNDTVRFGAVEVNIDLTAKPNKVESEIVKSDTFTVGEFEFTKRSTESEEKAVAEQIADIDT